MNKEKSIKLDVNDKDLAVKVLYARELGYNVEFSMSDYFKYTAAKNINITSFRIFSRFFSGVDTEGNKIDFSSYKGKEISYADMVDLIYKYPTHPKENNNIKTGYEFTALYEEYTKKKSLYDKAMKGELALSHYKTNSNDDRYAANALIFGSASLEIEHKNVKFYIDKNGIPSEIRNFSFIALDDNYDYKSNKIPTILNKIVQYALRDSSSATTKIRFIDDRGDNRFITINRTEFDWLKHHTPQINNESMDFRKFAIEASKIINARYNIIERYNPSFPLGFPYEIDYIRKPNIFKNTSDSSSSLSTFPHKTTTLADLSQKQVEFIIGQLGRSYVENFGEHKTPINKLDFTNKPVVDKNSENDATYLTSSLYTLVNKIFLNIYTKPSPVSIANTATDGFRVSNYNLSNNPLDLSKYRIGKSTIPQPINLNRFSLIGYSSLPVDPLILDLNGDGAKAVSYNDFSVLFDIDNDGGSLEETGWLSHQDGLLVRDLNNNGKIDNMSEVFSEYYAGRAGRNGEAGEKPFANGFEALKSLDSNKDNVFDSKDRDFNAVRVWQDANHNGITDAGELKTLKQLGITAIKLDYEEKGGQLFNGNELLAKGSFTRNGKQQEVVAVNFLANPRGHRISNANGGKKTVTEASGLIQGTTGWTAVDDVNRDLSAVTLGVENIQAGNGNDVLRGDAKDNWLAGGGGSDTFFGGDGNDVLLIDGDDLPENIHGGKGDDIVQVVGNKGVSLDLGAAEIEIAHGGRGNDVFVSSGNYSVFVRGGDGNDTIIGSIANDALSGENGDDFISGNEGKDLIRGHRGNDHLFGDEGDDVMFGGSDDDMLYGGEGNDTLLGEGGDDYLDGGEGEDTAEFSGNFADYKITKIGDGLLVSDKTQGRDGTDFLRNIEKLNFKDITNYSAPSAQEWENPIPVEDILYQDSRGQPFDGSRPYILRLSDLLKNDIDLQGDAISAYEATNIRGGTIQVLNANEIQFTPDPNFKGIASFEYAIEDSKGAKALQLSSGELKGKVYLVPPHLPQDPDIIRQYYLEADNILPVWENYTGKNIRIGQFEPSGPFSVAEEVADYRHPELRHQMDKQWLHDYEYKRQEEDKVFSKHATEVAGIMVAERNGEGGVGIAYDAKVASHWVGADVTSLNKMKHYDVANHSWGHRDNFRKPLPSLQA